MAKFTFKQAWFTNAQRQPQKPLPYKSGKLPGMSSQKLDQYLAAHPWPPIDPQHLPHISVDWGPKVHYKPPLYYPDGSTVRLMDKFLESVKAKK